VPSGPPANLPAAVRAFGRVLPGPASFPVLLIVASFVFLAGQHFFDRKDPKLALASGGREYSLRFEAPARRSVR
jgi:hypothetical protein